MQPPKKKPNWAKIRASYEAGEGSYRELAARFKVPIRTLEDRASRDRANGDPWTVSRGEVRGKAVAKVQDAIAQRVATKAISDLEIIDSALSALYASLTIEAKSLEGASNAIARLVQVKQQIAPPTADALAELAIAHGITPEDFVLALANKWQQQANGKSS